MPLLSEPMNYLLVVVSSFLVSSFTFPSIIFVSKQRHLFDDQHMHRKDHSKQISRLGGIGIFCSFMIITLLLIPQHSSIPLNYLHTACIILFAMGVKDDIVSVNPSTKIICQFCASALLVIPGEVRLKGFYGIFNVYELPVYGQIILSIIVIMLLINAFNLIDGINTLAAGMGIMATGTYGIMFAIMSEPELSAISFALAGALGGFMYYNISPARLFMGDTGSMLLGVIIAVLSIKYIEVFFEQHHSIIYQPESAPAFIIAIVLIPIFDTVRVFALRISKGLSPFKADKNHLHHILTNGGLTHEQAAMLLILFNALAIMLVILCDDFGNLFLIILLSALCILLSTLIKFISFKNTSQISSWKTAFNTFIF